MERRPQGEHMADEKSTNEPQGQPEGGAVEGGKAEGEAGERGENPAEDRREEKQQQQRQPLQHLEKAAVQRADRIQMQRKGESQQEHPQKRREDPDFQLRPEGAEKAGEEIPLPAAQAVDGAVVECGGGRAERQQRDGAEAPQQAHHHQLADIAEGRPDQAFRLKEAAGHLSRTAPAPASSAPRPAGCGLCASGACSRSC